MRLLLLLPKPHGAATLCCSAWWTCKGAVLPPDHVSTLPIVCRALQAGQPGYSIAGLAAQLEAVAEDGDRRSSRAVTAHPCSFHLTSTKPHPSLVVARSGGTPLCLQPSSLLVHKVHDAQIILAAGGLMAVPTTGICLTLNPLCSSHVRLMWLPGHSGPHICCPIGGAGAHSCVQGFSQLKAALCQADCRHVLIEWQLVHDEPLSRLSCSQHQHEAVCATSCVLLQVCGGFPSTVASGLSNWLHWPAT